MKKMNRYSKMIALLVAIAAIMFACVKDDFDTPPIKSKPIGDIYTIAEVKDFFTDPAGVYTFTEDASVFATVTMDNETDNSYRTFFIQDNTAGIAVYQDVSGGVYVGDSVRVYLKDLVVMKYQKLFQINSITGAGINVDSSLVKQGKNNKRTPEEVTIKEILSAIGYYQGRLVKVTDVQFVDTDTSKTLANAAELLTENRMLQDSSDNQIIVRTSGYATFANGEVPNGSGSIIAIVSQYGEDMQLSIRKYSELEMENERFDVAGSGGGGGGSAGELLYEDFSSIENPYDPIDISGWKVVIEEGTKDWHGDGYNGQSAEITAYESGEPSNIAWLITPAVNLSATTAPYLSFYSALKFYTDDILKVYVSTNYDGGDTPQTATWTELTSANIVDNTDPVDGASGYNFTESGNVDLSAYKSASVYIAFKYEGSNTKTTKYRVDNIKIAD